MNGFSKTCRYPVSQDMDAVMACVAGEVSQRAATGSLAHWSPKHLGLLTNAISKGQGPWVQPGLIQVAGALLTVWPLTVEAGWTAWNLAMMTNGLSKGEGQAVGKALAHLAGALPAAGELTAESGWNAPASGHGPPMA